MLFCMFRISTNKKNTCFLSTVYTTVDENEQFCLNKIDEQESIFREQTRESEKNIKATVNRHFYYNYPMCLVIYL